jgi:ElaB/YqjD/DUF883 family membrane-anchored ribosome-binding protein
MSAGRKSRLDDFWPKPPANGAAEEDNVRQFAARLEPIVENVGHAIATHPRTSLTVAAAIGAALGWFIKRK